MHFHSIFIMQDILFWFSLGVFVGQNEQILLLSSLPKTYSFWDLKFQFQCLVYFFSGRWIRLFLFPYLTTPSNSLSSQPSLDFASIIWIGIKGENRWHQWSTWPEPPVSPVVNIVLTSKKFLFCFARLWKVGTDNLCENNDNYRPWLWVSQVDQKAWQKNALSQLMHFLKDVISYELSIEWIGISLFTIGPFLCSKIILGITRYSLV